MLTYSAPPTANKFAFKPQIIDTSLPKRKFYAQTVLADIDNDGQLEFIVGQRRGSIFYYKYRGKAYGDAQWTRHLLGRRSPADVEAKAFDVDGDGWLDLVVGGAWYQNSRDENKPWKRHVFDRWLKDVHDISAADIDGDGRLEVVTMSDKNNLRWYKIPTDPTQPWIRHDIGKSVHAGLALGDIDGDGDVDIVRTDIWLENVNGDASRWIEHPIGCTSSEPPADFRPPYAYNATRCQIHDMNKDGSMDIVFTDGEIPGGKIWWMENVEGNGQRWQRHEIYTPDKTQPQRGAFHSLYVGDLDGDGDLDIFSCEMEAVRGDDSPKFYVWENLDGKATKWREHVVLDINLGGHEAVLGDVTGNGRLDILTKPWRANKNNALAGKMYVLFLEGIEPPLSLGDSCHQNAVI